MGHIVVLTGHVGSVTSREIRGKSRIATSFSVATNRYYTKNGRKEQETTWFRCTAFGAMAEVARDRIEKGMVVFVRGELMPDAVTGTPKIWQTPEGQYRANYEIKVLEFEPF